MPTLKWIGKEAVENHHLEIPYKLLKCDSSLSFGDNESGNLIVQGDNLEALKALLPYYAGQVKCIYIDPPYNTGNDIAPGKSWIYNDNVNSPEIKEWLYKVVGKEGEDLSRHDKWLCMMYPRLQLLRKFLKKEGLIFVSIDDNEVTLLRMIMDEIFGKRNFIQEIIWKNKYGPGAMTKGFGNIHEYILCYSRNPIISVEAFLSEEEIAKYKLKDEYYAKRGGYITQPLATKSKDDRPNLVYPIIYNGEEIWPDKQWIWERDRMNSAIKNNWVVIKKTKNKYSVRFKQYLKDENGVMRKAKPISIMNGPFNQEGTEEIVKIFGKKIFNNPKPVELIKYLISIIVNESVSKNDIVMDSFGGSGTTAHSVLSLNKENYNNLKFILIEMDQRISKDITRERVKRVINGYEYIDKNGEVKIIEGLGSGFKYCILDEPLFNEFGNIRENVTFSDLAHHIFFTETGVPLDAKFNKKGKNVQIGIYKEIAYYLLFNGIMGDKSINGGNVLTTKILEKLTGYKGKKIIYGEGCRLSSARLKRENIIFKQLPYEVKVS